MTVKEYSIPTAFLSLRSRLREPVLAAASVHALTQGPVAAPPETAAGLLAPALPRTHVHTHGGQKGPVTMESGHIT